MKPQKLIKQLQDFLNIDAQKKKKHRKDLKSLLTKMKKKEKKLKENLATENNAEEVERLKTEISILHAQRKKGIQSLKELVKS